MKDELGCVPNVVVFRRLLTLWQRGTPITVHLITFCVEYLIHLKRSVFYSFLRKIHNFHRKSLKKNTKKQPYLILTPTKYKQSRTLTD